LIAAMTLDEKISMLRGSVPGFPGQAAADPLANGEVGYLPGIPRLGIPPLRFTDGPAGVRITPPTTAMPAPVSLAATFSPSARNWTLRRMRRSRGMWPRRARCC